MAKALSAGFQRIVHRAATRVFAVLADPTTHAAIDGTGWVQESADRAPLTEPGQIFRMDMHHPDHPNGDYQVVNKVEVLDPPRAIGWLTGQEKDDGHLPLRSPGSLSLNRALMATGPSPSMPRQAAEPDLDVRSLSGITATSAGR